MARRAGSPTWQLSSVVIAFNSCSTCFSLLQCRLSSRQLGKATQPKDIASSVLLAGTSGGLDSILLPRGGSARASCPELCPAGCLHGWTLHLPGQPVPALDHPHSTNPPLASLCLPCDEVSKAKWWFLWELAGVRVFFPIHKMSMLFDWS